MDHKRIGVSGFGIAKQVLGSKIEYREGNVYDLSPDELGSFDLILFLGVIYHLRHPLLALDRLRALSRPRGAIVVESLICDHCLFFGYEESRELPAQLREIPLAQFLPMGRFHNDPTNKWSPNLACLRDMVEDAGFEVERSKQSRGRGLVFARAAQDSERQRINEMDTGRREDP